MLTRRSLLPRALAIPLVLLLALPLALTAAAQPPDTGGPRPPSPISGTAPVNAHGISAAVLQGQPGLSYRYVDTFGDTEVAYSDDPDHLYAPYGVGVGG